MTKFGIDNYTYNLLIEYFKSRRNIKFVKIIGSRMKGTFRKSSDIDFLVEGIFDEDILSEYNKEINSLKQPYRIDLIDVNNPNKKNFVGINFYKSSYFYKAKDFYPEDNYKEKCDIKEIIDQRARWEQRYESRFLRNWILFNDNLNLCNQEFYSNCDITTQINLFKSFKYIFEAFWKMLKDFMHDKNINVLFPREIFEHAFKLGIIKNPDIWNNMIYDFNVMTDENFVEISEELYYRLNAIYLPEIIQLQQFFSEKYNDINFYNDNKFGLNDYVYNLIIDFFKSKSEIKEARIYGSRVLGNARKSSDIDFFVECTCDDKTINVYKKEINNLRHPYNIDLINLNTDIPSGIHFIKCSYDDSELFYRRNNYFNEENHTEDSILSREKENVVRWKYRFETAFIRVYKEFEIANNQLLENIKENSFDINRQINFFVQFKNLFKGCWKTLKDYLKENGNNILLPRDILIEASKQGLINNYQIWSDIIYDFNIMTDEPFVTINDELIYRLETIYLPEIQKLYEKLYEQYKTGYQNKYSLFNE